jgi:P27 family predicted phage terminase small subunit
MGRTRTPTALRVLRGNPQHRPLPKAEPKPQRGVPPCPSRLSPSERRAWRGFGELLDGMGVLTVADAPQLALLVCVWAEWRGWDDACRKRESPTYEQRTERGLIIRPYPEFALRAEAGKRLRALLADMGLNPSARARVTALPGGDGGEGAGWEPGRKG